MSPGPFRPFLDGLARVQSHFDGASPIRTALVTARGAPAHFRVINTLRSWGVEIDETFFLGGVDKTEVLAAFGAHIFFDDQQAHVESAANRVPAAQVLWPADEFGLGDASPGSVVVTPGARPGSSVEAMTGATKRRRRRSVGDPTTSRSTKEDVTTA